MKNHNDYLLFRVQVKNMVGEKQCINLEYSQFRKKKNIVSFET